MVRPVGAILALAAAAVPSVAETDPIPDGRLVWAAFTCAAYAETLGDQGEQKRFVALGIDAGRRFVQAAIDGKLDAEAVKASTPVGVAWRMAGPSADFVVGRIFEGAFADAVDKVWEVGSEPDAQSLQARNLCVQANCDLLGR